MPDLPPDVTTTPNFDPGRVAIASGWLVYDVGYHTCGGYGPESGYAHEPGCGAEPICKVADIPDILAAAAERDALAAAWDEGHQPPHLPASAAAPVVLPTAKEVREAIIAGTKLGGWMPHTAAQAVLDLIASRVRHWVPVEPGTLIKAGTRLREDWGDQITEWTLGEDQDPYQNCGRQHRYYIDPATVPAEPEDPRIKRAHAIIPALQRVKNVPLGGDLLPAALEAIDALEADR